MFLLDGHAVPGDVSQQIKAAYLYNILQFVSFPENAFYVPGVLNVCLLGEDRFGAVLNEIDGARIPQGVLNITRLGAYGVEKSLNNCNALYVVETEKPHIQSILTEVDPKKILTISEFSPFIQYGGLIELFEQNDRIRFRVNEALVKETDFQVAAQLIQLGIRQ